MTLLCWKKMGCGQSIRKKSKHKSDRTRASSGNGSYDNHSHDNPASSVATGVAGPSRKPLGYDPLTPMSAEEMDTLLTRSTGSVGSDSNHQQTSGSIRSKGGGSKDPHQANGELRQATNRDPFREQEKSPTKYNQSKGPLYTQLRISTSQSEFFRMLDEKVEKGPDYFSQKEA